MCIRVGDHVVGRQTLRLTGRVEQMFRAEWKAVPRKGYRILHMRDPSVIDAGPLFCAVRLVRSYSVFDDTSEIPSGVHPVVTGKKDGWVEVAYVPAEFLQSIPDGI